MLQECEGKNFSPVPVSGSTIFLKPGPHTDPIKTNAISSALVKKYRRPFVHTVYL